MYVHLQITKNSIMITRIPFNMIRIHFVLFSYWYNQNSFLSVIIYFIIKEEEEFVIMRLTFCGKAQNSISLFNNGKKKTRIIYHTILQ